MKKVIIVFLFSILASSLYCQFDYTESLFPNEKAAITIGFLNGGGSLIGADFEFMVTNKLGLQAGLGYVGYGAGLNYHLKSGGVRSSFINLGYCTREFVIHMFRA